ncbi:MAG TPA: RNA 2',3'-cyclic phosphodiesterase [Caulobacteraceae bacterium]
MIRLFAALAIPEDIGAGLASRQKGLLGARWRPAESLHVTLRFFGGVSEDRADDLDSELAAIGGAGFALSLKGVGFFGAGEEIRAVWAAVAQSEPLNRLAARCESAARRAGLPRETRAWRPHVTLAHLRHPDPAAVAAWMQTHNLLKSPPFPVRRFGLYSSWPGEASSVYRLERAYPLAAA